VLVGSESSSTSTAAALAERWPSDRRMLSKTESACATIADGSPTLAGSNTVLPFCASRPKALMYCSAMRRLTASKPPGDRMALAVRRMPSAATTTTAPTTVTAMLTTRTTATTTRRQQGRGCR
jgi:hypothetical protein